MDLEKVKSDILESALKDVSFDGWSVAVFQNAAQKAGYDAGMVDALFPRGERDLIVFFSKWADQKMLAALPHIDNKNMRVRDRIKLAVETRIAILNPYKDCVRICFKSIIHPQNARLSASITWATSDAIWTWAGDQSDDYNYYTKRTLLGGVISTTMVYWLRDTSDNHEKTLDFLERRIENVLFIGKNAGKVISPLAKFGKRFIVPNNPFNKYKA